jgi:hypothetical protein
MDILKFNISDLELIEEVSNSQFAKVRIKAFASGDNAHNMPVDISALKNAEKSIINKPVTYIYDPKNDDASNHGNAEIPCGFVNAETSNIHYEIDDDGRMMFCVDALIWKNYSGRMFEIFKRDGVKSVSVVITVIDTKKLDDNKTAITSFCYNAITVLGDEVNPAIKDAELELLEFSKAKDEFENKLFSKDSNLDIEKQEKEGQEIMEFNKEEFAKVVDMTALELMEKMQLACGDKKYTVDGEEYEYTQYYIQDYNAEYIFALDMQYGKMMALPYTLENGEIMVDYEKAMGASMKYVVEDGEVEASVFEFQEIIQEKLQRQEEKFSAEKEELKKEIEKFSQLVEEKEVMEKEYNEYKQSFSELQEENEKLKEFKFNIEEAEKQSKIEFAINLVAEDLTQDQIDEWKNKVQEFENVESFTNAIQSFAYSQTKRKKKGQSNDIVRIALPKSDEDREISKSLWDRLKA